MYVKLKSEDRDRYHFCKDHLNQMDKLDVLDDPDQLDDDCFSRPQKVCEECQDMAERGECDPVYVVTGSFTDKN